MHPFLRYILSTSTPRGAARTELEALYPQIDDRWNQKIDRARCVVTVYDAQLLVAAGVVHDAVIAPTSSMGAVELGCMVVRPEYRRQGIRQKVTELRLEFALSAGRTPITVIDSANPSSWAAYERSELWERERSFEVEGHTKYLYRALGSARISPPHLSSHEASQTAARPLLDSASLCWGTQLSEVVTQGS